MLVVLVGCGAIAGAVAHRKQLGFGKFFVLGFVLGIFGILWAVPIPPGAPAGMRSVTCRRCNKRQNIPVSQNEFQCWHLTIAVTARATECRRVPTVASRAQYFVGRLNLLNLWRATDCLAGLTPIIGRRGLVPGSSHGN